MSYTLELASFTTADKLSLPGLLYQPTPPSKKAILFLHGNGSTSVFYKAEKMNLLAKLFTNAGWAFLPFNNRGAHYLKKFSIYEHGERVLEVLHGTAMEVIRDAVIDIEAALEFLQQRGYTEFVLVGESSGANKICVYHHYRPDNTVKGYVLVGGGDDTGLFYQQLGKEPFWQLLAESKLRVQQGRDQELFSADLAQPKFAYRALADIMDPDGDYNCFPFYEYFTGEKLSTKPLFQYFTEINKQTLVLYGSEDPFCIRPAAEASRVFSQVHPHPELITTRVTQGADHSFHDMEAAEGQEILSWLEQTNY